MSLYPVIEPAVNPLIQQVPHVACMLERHGRFFQNNQPGDFVSLPMFYARLIQLGVTPAKAALVATAICAVGSWKTCDNWGDYLQGRGIYLPNIGRLVHAPADAGIYQADGSIKPPHQVLADAYQVDDQGRRYLTFEAIKAHITVRNGGKEPSALQIGEYQLLFEIMKNKRDQDVLYETDISELYHGTLFYNLVGERAPWLPAPN